MSRLPKLICVASVPYKTECYMNVAVVEHHNCLEIIAFEPILQVAAPRLYVNLTLLKSKFQCTIAQSNQSNQLYTESDIARYVVDRLISPSLVDQSRFIIHLIAIEDDDIVVDEASKRLDIEYSGRPKHVSPYPIDWSNRSLNLEAVAGGTSTDCNSGNSGYRVSDDVTAASTVYSVCSPTRPVTAKTSRTVAHRRGSISNKINDAEYLSLMNKASSVESTTHDVATPATEIFNHPLSLKIPVVEVDEEEMESRLAKGTADKSKSSPRARPSLNNISTRMSMFQGQLLFPSITAAEGKDCMSPSITTRCGNRDNAGYPPRGNSSSGLNGVVLPPLLSRNTTAGSSLSLATDDDDTSGVLLTSREGLYNYTPPCTPSTGAGARVSSNLCSWPVKLAPLTLDWDCAMHTSSKTSRNTSATVTPRGSYYSPASPRSRCGSWFTAETTCCSIVSTSCDSPSTKLYDGIASPHSKKSIAATPSCRQGKWTSTMVQDDSGWWASSDRAGLSTATMTYQQEFCDMVQVEDFENLFTYRATTPRLMAPAPSFAILPPSTTTAAEMTVEVLCTSGILQVQTISPTSKYSATRGLPPRRGANKPSPTTLKYVGQ